MTSIYILHDGKMLLLYRIGSKVVQPSWCGIGGHFEKDELNNPRACILRELNEETGITEKELNNIKLRYITFRMKDNEIRQNYYYFAELESKEVSIDICNEGILEWVSIDKVMEKEMPFTAKECLKHYLSIGIYNDKLYAGAAAPEGVNFMELKEF